MKSKSGCCSWEENHLYSDKHLLSLQSVKLMKVIPSSTIVLQQIALVGALMSDGGSSLNSGHQPPHEEPLRHWAKSSQQNNGRRFSSLEVDTQRWTSLVVDGFSSFRGRATCRPRHGREFREREIKITQSTLKALDKIKNGKQSIWINCSPTLLYAHLISPELMDSHNHLACKEKAPRPPPREVLYDSSSF